LGENNAEVAESLLSLGALHARQKNFGPAEISLRDALEMQYKLLGEQDVAVAETMGLLAMLYYKQSVFAEASRFAQKGVDIRTEVLGPNHPDVAMSLHIQAMTAAAQKEFDQSLTLYDRVLNIRQHYYPREHALVTSVVRSIGMIYLRTRNFAQAQAVFEDLERITEAGSKTEEMIFAVKQLGWLYVLQRNFDSGQVYITRSLRRLQNVEKADRVRDNLMMALFCCHVGLKDYFSAAKALPAAARILAKNRTADKQLFKHGFKTGLYAGRRG
jgi:tetratricopeptide (TPR) repeat protein